MWEWFLPASERSKYYSQIMEGSGGGGGPLWTPWEQLNTTEKFKRLGGWVLFIVIVVALAAFLDWLSP